MRWALKLLLGSLSRDYPALIGAEAGSYALLATVIVEVKPFENSQAALVLALLVGLHKVRELTQIRIPLARELT